MECTEDDLIVIDEGSTAKDDSSSINIDERKYVFDVM